MTEILQCVHSILAIDLYKTLPQKFGIYYEIEMDIPAGAILLVTPLPDSYVVYLILDQPYGKSDLASKRGAF